MLNPATFKPAIKGSISLAAFQSQQQHVVAKKLPL
jgi:hypothetical protein